MNSSRRNARLCLGDAKERAERLVKWSHSQTLETVVAEWELQSLIEREIMVIGEAIVQARQQRPDLTEQIPELQRIIGARNLLAHGYYVINIKVLWEVITEHMPSLIDTIDTILASPDA